MKSSSGGMLPPSHDFDEFAEVEPESNPELLRGGNRSSMLGPVFFSLFSLIATPPFMVYFNALNSIIQNNGGDFNLRRKLDDQRPETAHIKQRPESAEEPSLQAALKASDITLPQAPQTVEAFLTS